MAFVHGVPVEEADPWFERAGLGGPGDGGGTLCNQEGEIEEVDFDVEITSLDAIPVIARFLEHAGAPRGSELSYDRRGEPVVVPFGVVEGVAIYLDGVALPQEIYDTTSAQELAGSLPPTIRRRSSLRTPSPTCTMTTAC